MKIVSLSFCSKTKISLHLLETSWIHVIIPKYYELIPCHAKWMTLFE